MNRTFELLGISGKDYRFKWVKITIYLDPIDYSKRIRLLIKVFFEPMVDFSNSIYIHLQSNRNIGIENDEILNKSEKISNIVYSERIGADKLVKKAVPLKIEHPIVYMEGEDNKISIKITPIEEMNDILKNEKEKQKNNQEDFEVGFGFMLDTVIKNEGIEEEPLLKNLLGFSQFAWKFHFKVWSMIEDLEPIGPIFSNPTEGVQMFLVIPKALIRSHGQIVAHPGEEAMHTMTLRDKNTFILSEKEYDKEKLKEKIESWFEEGAMAISWRHGKTGSMSREAIVEHRQAYPRAWTLLTFFFLLLVLGINLFPRSLLCSLVELCFSEKSPSPWIYILPILFVFSYFVANIYNFSFYELKKITKTKFLVIFLVISMLSLIVSTSLIVTIEGFPERFRSLTFFAFIIIVAASILSLLKENQEIKRGNVRIREDERIPYLVTRTLVQFFAVFVGVLISTRFLDPNVVPLSIELFISFLSYVYGIVIGMESSPILIKYVVS